LLPTASAHPNNGSSEITDKDASPVVPPCSVSNRLEEENSAIADQQPAVSSPAPDDESVASHAAGLLPKADSLDELLKLIEDQPTLVPEELQSQSPQEAHANSTSRVEVAAHLQHQLRPTEIDDNSIIRNIVLTNKRRRGLSVKSRKNSSTEDDFEL
jgi:hypothetical protein